MGEVCRKIYRHLRNIPGDAKRRAYFSRAKRALLVSKDLTDQEKWVLQRVSLRVHPQDTMYEPGNASGYLLAGLSAGRCIQAALQAAGKANAVGAILDFPCGYGRVLRFLKVMFPDSHITGGEIRTTALDFCQRTFTVTPLLSSTDFSSLSLPRKFDLIWCGSLITHIDEQATIDLLRFFYRQLLDGGICIFTTHGQHPLQQIKDKTKTYGLSAARPGKRSWASSKRKVMDTPTISTGRVAAFLWFPALESLD